MGHMMNDCRVSLGLPDQLELRDPKEIEDRKEIEEHLDNLDLMEHLLVS